MVFFAHTADVTAAERATLEARGIAVVDGTVERLVVEDDRLTGVELTDGRGIPRDALFIRPAQRAHADGLAAGLGCELLAGGLVRVDPDGRTSMPGVWAAGNATNPRAQVITAAGEGSAVAIAINAELVHDDVATRMTTIETGGPAMTPEHPPVRTPPPTRHQLALMIWLCVFPTLTVLNVAYSATGSAPCPLSCGRSSSRRSPCRSSSTA